MILDRLQTVVKNNPQANPLYLRNLLKETLQFYALDFVYTSSWGDPLLFKGGTCLRLCFDLPRLSEDLDFDIKNVSKFDLNLFVKDLSSYFISKWQFRDFTYKVAGNNRQVFLQFPVLKKLNLATKNESDILFLRLDLSPVDCKIFKEEISLKTSYDFNFIVKRYSLEDLFASKITAILTRTFQKGKDSKITFKGRDYFDLIWFLQRGIKPNIPRLEKLTKKTFSAIKKDLEKNVQNINENYLSEDLKPLFADEKFVKTFCQNFKQLYFSLAASNVADRHT